MILFVQPFSLSAPGGGPRILRALLKEAPCSILSVCTSPQKPPSTSVAPEIHLPYRPDLKRLEHTRLNKICNQIGRFFSDSFCGNLAKVCQEKQVKAIHGIAHAIDCWYAYQVSKECGIDFYLSVHDDMVNFFVDAVGAKAADNCMSEMWKNAKARFVITDVLGNEYSKRYGKRSFLTITDGLDAIHQQREKQLFAGFRIYFMGLFHMSYEPNLQALLKSLASLRQTHPHQPISMTSRGGYPRQQCLQDLFPVTVLPFAADDVIKQDLESADFLYLPLPFGEENLNFVRYSLSTKMVSYLGSGLPILYHGPRDSAACHLLAKAGAAHILDTLDVDLMVKNLNAAHEKGDLITRNALALAQRSFMLEDQKARFWKSFGSN